MRPFDIDADGTLFGEGFAAVVLQINTVSEDTHSQLVGWTSNRNSTVLPIGFTSMDMVEACATDALMRSAVHRNDINFCHLHGMGNPASDEPEVMGLTAALDRSPSNPLALAGHKATFGHTISVAGIVAVVFSVLSMQHGMVPAHVNVEHVTEMVRNNLTVTLPVGKPFELNAKGGKTISSISGLSGSGDNVHLMLSHNDKLAKDRVQLDSFGSIQVTPSQEVDQLTRHVSISQAKLPETDDDHSLVASIRQVVEQLIGRPVQPTQPLLQAGLTSKQVPLLVRALGAGLRESVVFSHPTVESIARYLQQQGTDDITPLLHFESRALGARNPVVVASTNGVAFGSCESTQKMWLELCSGHDQLDSCRNLHQDHGADNDSRRPLPGHMLQSPELFDAAYFSISPLEVKVTDPNQRVCLQVAFGAFARAGSDLQSLKETKVGIYVGFGNLTGWSEVQREIPKNTFSELGLGTSAVSGRISYVLG